MKILNHSKNTLIKLASCLILLSSISTNMAFSGPADFNYLVSPPSCRPISASDGTKLRLINGAWAYRTQYSGTAKLQCPVTFSAVNPSQRMSMILLAYRNGYANAGSNSDNGYVEARLKYRTRDQVGFSNLGYLSTSFPGDNSIYGFRHASSGSENFANHPSIGLMYFVEIQMWRKNNTDEPLAFTGFEIRFTP